MCIIVVKKRGVALPDNLFRIVANCFISNTDGAGVMIKRPSEDGIYIKKGLMTYNETKSAIKKLDVDIADEFAMHFRIGTSGGKAPNMTHPFVIDRRESVVLTMEGLVKQACLMHNGGFQGLPDTYSGKYSDTYFFAKDILGTYNPKAGKRAMKKWRGRFKKVLSYNKIAVMFPQKEKDIELLGRWFYKYGLFFSHGGFEYYYNWSMDRLEEKAQLAGRLKNLHYDELTTACMGSE